MLPGISVIICCYNSVARLPETLKHLALQSVPANIPWEIIVVDNASTDNTFELAHKEWGKYHLQIGFQVIKEPGPGKNNAFKTGIKHAAYEYILTCDDDNRLLSDYISTAFELMQNDKQIGVLGGCGTFDPEHPEWPGIYEFESCYVNGIQTWVETDHWVYGAGSIYRIDLINWLFRHNWQQVTSGRKGASLICGEDVEFCFMYYLAGYKIIADERLKFNHFVPLNRQNLKYIMRLYYWNSYSNILLNNYRLLSDHTIPSLRKSNTRLMYGSFVRLVKYTLILSFQFLRSGKKPDNRQKITFNSLAGALSALINNRKKLLNQFEHLQQLITATGFQAMKHKNEQHTVL